MTSLKKIEIDGRTFDLGDFSEYAKLASPTFTGTPRAPTASKTTNTTQIATTAFVKNVVADYALSSSLGSLASEDSITHTEVSDWDTATAGFLSLSGGTMTGTIRTSSAVSMRGDTDTSYVGVYGGTDATSWVAIYGKSHSTYAGHLRVKCSNGTNTAYLDLAPDGTGTWAGNALATQAWVTSQINSITDADSTGY